MTYNLNTTLTKDANVLHSDPNDNSFLAFLDMTSHIKISVMVILHLWPQPIVFTAFRSEVDALSDNVPFVASVQSNEGLNGDFEIVGFEVGSKEGNFDGTLRGALVGLCPRRAKDLAVSSLHTIISLSIKVEFRVTKVLDPRYLYKVYN